MPPDDPRHVVEAPIRGALTGVMARGIALVGLVVCCALAPTLPVLCDVCDGLAIGVTAFLLGFGTWVHVRRWLRSPVDDRVRSTAWQTAREVDPDDMMLALVIAGWVPVALGIALLVMLWPHLVDPSPTIRGAWIVMAIPPVVAAWAFSTTAWLETCRDALARAIGESERRYRSYWTNLGRS
jgi:hypothetical protein